MMEQARVAEQRREPQEEQQVQELEPVPAQTRLQKLKLAQLLALKQVLARAPAQAHQAQRLAQEVEQILRERRAAGQAQLRLQVRQALRLPCGTPITGGQPGPAPTTRKRPGPNGVLTSKSRSTPPTPRTRRSAS